MNLGEQLKQNIIRHQEEIKDKAYRQRIHIQEELETSIKSGEPNCSFHFLRTFNDSDFSLLNDKIQLDLLKDWANENGLEMKFEGLYLCEKYIIFDPR